MTLPTVLLLCLPLAMSTAADCGAAEFRTQDARIRVQVRASVYTYDVWNLGRDPLARFEVPSANTYNFTVPEGWETNVEDGVFRAWARRPNRQIAQGQSAQFSFRVTSSGAVLGRVPVRIVTESRREIRFEHAWGAVPQPRAYLATVVLMLVAVFTGHTLLLRFRARRAAYATAPQSRPSTGSDRE